MLLLIKTVCGQWQWSCALFPERTLVCKTADLDVWISVANSVWPWWNGE